MIDALGNNWGFIGWCLPIAGFLVGMLSARSESVAGGIIALVCLALGIVWWVIDMFWQRVPLWQVAIGIVMIAIAVIGRAPILAIACWAIYMTRIRE